MTVRNGTATLPPPATAAGRASGRPHDDDLIHICDRHSDDRNGGDLACQLGIGCISYCGVDLRDDPWLSDDGHDRPNDCIVCVDLWEGSPE